jgi:hypothetical protein
VLRKPSYPIAIALPDGRLLNVASILLDVRICAASLHYSWPNAVENLKNHLLTGVPRDVHDEHLCWSTNCNQHSTFVSLACSKRLRYATQLLKTGCAAIGAGSKHTYIKMREASTSINPDHMSELQHQTYEYC